MKHGGNEMQCCDSLLGDVLTEIIGIAMSSGLCHNQCRATYQGPKKLPHRDIEAIGSLL